jgi:hypothetical protein
MANQISHITDTNHNACALRTGFAIR